MSKRLFPPLPAPPPSALTRLPPWGRLLAVTALYLLAAQAAFAIGVGGLGMLVPFWPAAGIALAALLLGGQGLWPAIFLGSAAVPLLSGHGPAASLAIGGGNALGAWAACRLLQGPLAIDLRLERPRDVLHLCFSAPALSAALSGLVGIAALALAGRVEPGQALQAWRVWWVGDIVGSQLLAPLLLAWLLPRSSTPGDSTPLLAPAALLALAGTALWFFAGQSPEYFAYAGLLWLLVLLWLAFSWDLRPVTLALTGTAALAAAFAAQGSGPFADLPPPLVQVKLQVLITCVTAMTLALAAANRQRRRAEAERSHMEARLEQVLDSLGDVIWTLEADRRFSFFSGAMERHFGRPVADFYADPQLWLEYVLPEDREAVRQVFAAQFQGIPADHEFRIRDRHERLRWMRVRSHPQVQDGQVLRVHGIAQDITSLRRTAERLGASEERLRRALGASEVGVWDWAVDSGALEFVQAVAEGGVYRLAERSVDLAKWEESLHPDDRGRVMQALADCRDGRQPRFRSEYRTLTRQGHWRWFRGEGQVVQNDAGGRCLRLAGTFRDIHERKQVEVELEKLSMAVEQNPSVVFITDAQGHFEYCNPAFSEVTGYALEEILGKTPRLLKSGLNENEAYAGLWRTINAGRTWHGRLLNRRRDGSLYVCQQAIAPIRDANGRITHFVSISQDLSEMGEGGAYWPGRDNEGN